MAETIIFGTLPIKIAENKFFLLAEVGSRNTRTHTGGIAKHTQSLSLILDSSKTKSLILDNTIDYSEDIDRVIEETNELYNIKDASLSEFFYMSKVGHVPITKTTYLNIIKTLDKKSITLSELMEKYVLSNGKEDLKTESEVIEALENGNNVYPKYMDLPTFKKYDVSKLKKAEKPYTISIYCDDEFYGYASTTKRKGYLVTTKDIVLTRRYETKASVNAAISRYSKNFPGFELRLHEIK